MIDMRKVGDCEVSNIQLKTKLHTSQRPWIPTMSTILHIHFWTQFNNIYSIIHVAIQGKYCWLQYF